MELNKAISILEGIKNGTLGTVVYESELPVNKTAKAAGLKVMCRTKKMVRFGAAYKNLVKDAPIKDSKPRANNYSWVIENKLTHNSNTEKDYIRVSNINRKTISREYYLVGDAGIVSSKTPKIEEFEDLLQASYLKNKSYSKPIVQNITLANVLAINGVM